MHQIEPDLGMRYSALLAQHALSHDTSVMWELRRKATGSALVCQLALQGDRTWLLTVTLGTNLLHGETFRQRAHALNLGVSSCWIADESELKRRADR